MRETRTTMSTSRQRCLSMERRLFTNGTNSTDPVVANRYAWLAGLITRQEPLAGFADALAAQPDDIKVVVTFPTSTKA